MVYCSHVTHMLMLYQRSYYTRQWINIGPIFDTLVERVEEKYEGKRLVLITSGNISGRGNPASSTFSIDAVDDELLDRVDMTIDIPHWSDPELDDNGRWYSAPMFDMDSCTFRRVGKHMEYANIVASLFHEIDEDGSKISDLLQVWSRWRGA